MSIKHNIKIEPISEDDFYLLYCKLTELRSSIHNDLGRFRHENIYQHELAHRCQTIEFEKVTTELPIQICCGVNHSRGGEEYVAEKIDAVNGSHFLDTQKIHLLNSEIAFNMSSVTKAASS